VQGFVRVPLNDLEAVRQVAERNKNVVAVFVEPIQGEGGYIVPPAGWLAALRELCDRHGILLVIDEVQSGVGRTGTMWACEHELIEPDIMCIGKGLASGLPLAGIVARDELMDWEPGGHGSTFGGNPVACAAACAVCDALTDELLEHVAETGAHLATGLAALPGVEEVRGRGLLLGAELDRPAADVVAACLERGLLVTSAGERVLRLSPPLVAGKREAEEALAFLAEVLA
jgi:acetylornithine/succinyldiaminopimelate/putrescine aminotransferase